MGDWWTVNRARRRGWGMLVLVGLGCCLACGKKSQDLLQELGPNEQDKVEFATNLMKIDNVFEVFAMREEREQKGETASTEYRLIDKRFAFLREQFEQQRFQREVDLAGLRWEKIGDERYRISLLFQAREVPSEDYHFQVHADVRNEHLILISEKRRLNGFENWSLACKTPTTKWQPGRYYTATKEVDAKPIPYHLKALLISVKHEKRVGRRLKIGWKIDPSDEEKAAE